MIRYILRYVPFVYSNSAWAGNIFAFFFIVKTIKKGNKNQAD
jgi:hypothetical protein